jgi:hypothetical protein
MCNQDVNVNVAVRLMFTWYSRRLPTTDLFPRRVVCHLNILNIQWIKVVGKIIYLTFKHYTLWKVWRLSQYSLPLQCLVTLIFPKVLVFKYFKFLLIINVNWIQSVSCCSFPKECPKQHQGCSTFPLCSRTYNTLTIALMMEAARTSETSVDIQLITRQYIPEDSELQK